MTYKAYEKIYNEIRDLSGIKENIIVGIDGMSASGKSTLASQLEIDFHSLCATIKMDDFFAVMSDSVMAHITPKQGYEDFFDWKRLESEVLIPISKNKNTYYQCFDWESPISKLNNKKSFHKLTKINIIEGIYSFRPELQKYFDYAILVETPKETRMSRMEKRNSFSKAKRTLWMTSEEWYMKNVLDRNAINAIFLGI